MTKKPKEEPIQMKSKEEIDQCKFIREGFMSICNQDVVFHKTQQAFCSPESEEWKYHEYCISSINRQRATYGQQ